MSTDKQVGTSQIGVVPQGFGACTQSKALLETGPTKRSGTGATGHCMLTSFLLSKGMQGRHGIANTAVR